MSFFFVRSKSRGDRESYAPPSNLAGTSWYFSTHYFDAILYYLVCLFFNCFIINLYELFK